MSVGTAAAPSGPAVFTIDGAHGRARVLRQGAHLTSWVPAGGAEVLFVSAAARHAAGTPVRGGVPVAFPQFAELGPLPVHGFAQFAQWERRVGTDERLTLVLRDSAATRTLWPHAFVAELTVRLAPGALDLGFAVHNPGRQTLTWSGALHTYLAVDARGARLRGLGPGPYLDRADGSRRRHDEVVELRIPGHTDRAYLDAGTRVEVDDGRRRLAVRKTGFRDCVVWNPGPETTHRFDDLLPGDHAAFVCVEAAEVRPVPVAPGATWRGTQAIFAARTRTR